MKRLEWNVCIFCNSFSASNYVDLFEVYLLFKFFSLSSKSVFYMKLAILFLVAKFGCANIAAKFYDMNLLHSGVVVYLSWSWSVIFFFNFTNFCVVVSFLTKLLTLGILFSTAVRAVVITKLVILGILPLFTFILALKSVVVANFKLVVSGILS